MNGFSHILFTISFHFKHSFITLCVYTINCSKEQNNFLFHNFFLRAATSQTCSPILLFEINFMIYEEYQRIAYIALEIREFKYFIKGQSLSRLAFFVLISKI